MSKEKRRKSKQKYELDIEAQTKFNLLYIALMSSSGILASVAFLVNSIPLLIGSMVVAPVMPPLVLISIGMANGNYRNILKGLALTFSGLTIALAFSVGTTWLLSFTGLNPANLDLPPMLIERVTPGWYSLVAALAAGTAGALAVSHQKQDTLVGAVASIALVPTVAGTGIAILLTDWQNVLGGLGMLGINVGAIVFMGWLVFNFFSESGE
ncbi:MAG: DUF389 domain-containing protein [Chitinispirillaceae bacterium]